jgi:hypothetical protein
VIVKKIHIDYKIYLQTSKSLIVFVKKIHIDYKIYSQTSKSFIVFVNHISNIMMGENHP